MTASDKNADIAIVHDQFVEHGGAEHVAEEIARTFDAPIYSGVVDPGVPASDVDVREVFDGFGKLLMGSHYLVQDAYQMLGWQYVEDLHDYETVILTKNNPGWYVPRDWQTVVKYCHSTPRQPYDRLHEVGEPVDIDWLPWPADRVLEGSLTGLLRAKDTIVRLLYGPNLPYPDTWICNSDLVQRRLDLYWDISTAESHVVYPPVDVDAFASAQTSDDEGKYYFTFSRLHPHKRIDDIISAFNMLAKDDPDAYRLVIGGKGPDRDRLESLAGDTVEFVGYMDEAEKRRRLAECKAFVFAAENEDFGLTPVESMAAGTPVIGVADGFTEHQILDGKNGFSFARAGGHLRETVRYFERRGVAWDAPRIHEFATRFGRDRFKAEMRQLVRETQAETQVSPPWQDAVEISLEEPVANPDDIDAPVPDGGSE